MPTWPHRMACRFHHQLPHAVRVLRWFVRSLFHRWRPCRNEARTRIIIINSSIGKRSEDDPGWTPGEWLHRDKNIKFIVLAHLEKGNLQHSSELLNWYAVPTMLERTAGRLARDLVRVNGFDPLCKPSVREPPRERPPSLRRKTLRDPPSR